MGPVDQPRGGLPHDGVNMSTQRQGQRVYPMTGPTDDLPAEGPTSTPWWGQKRHLPHGGVNRSSCSGAIWSAPKLDVLSCPYETWGNPEAPQAPGAALLHPLKTWRKATS